MKKIEIFTVEIFGELMGERFEVKAIDDLVGFSFKISKDDDGFFLEKSAIEIGSETFGVFFETDDECVDLLFTMYELWYLDRWLFQFDLLNHAQLYL